MYPPAFFSSRIVPATSITSLPTKFYLQNTCQETAIRLTRNSNKFGKPCRSSESGDEWDTGYRRARCCNEWTHDNAITEKDILQD